MTMSLILFTLFATMAIVPWGMILNRNAGIFTQVTGLFGLIIILFINI